MKCEDPGFHARTTIQVIEPGNLTEEMQSRIEAFGFPLDEYPIPEVREKEIAYDRMYIPRSVYIIHYSPLDPSSFMAVARIIEKRRPEDKLPLEFATVVKATVDSKTSPKRDIAGMPFPVDYYDSRLPVCEIGGLRVAGIDPAKGITLKVRYRALNEVMMQCDKQVHDRGYKSFFLTCIGTPHMERLYHDKFFFDEVANISYHGSPTTWKALWRVPFHNPVKKIEYSQSSAFNAPGHPWKPSGITTCLVPGDERPSGHTRELERVC